MLAGMWGVNPEFGLEALSLEPEPLFVLLAALLIDGLTGNITRLRRYVPHPVFLIAAGVNWLEFRLNRERRSNYARLIRGLIVVIAVTGLSVGAGWSVAVVAAQLPFGWLLALIAIAALVAQRGPFDEVHRMVRGLRSNDLHAAREAAAVFLGSNADTCDEAALVRAGTNHLAVQYLIGLVAAVFWFVLLGIPGLFAWRAVNVMGCLLDSSDPRQAYFGWVPTRFNDAAAYLPSLIAGLLIIVAAAFVPAANPVRALRVMLRDGSKHRSLSLGSPVAAMAGALGVTLAGPRQLLPAALYRAVRGGIPKSEPWVGEQDGRQAVSRADAARALYLYGVSCLLVFLAIAVMIVVQYAAA